MAADQIKVLFVCLGNICRSPTAHGVFESLLKVHKMDRHILVDSAGTGDWHIGREPDPRTIAAAKQRGYALRHLRARQVRASDFHEFDYVLAMDQQNLLDLENMRPQSFDGTLDLFLSFTQDGAVRSEREVPDPYTGGEAGFEQVLDRVEQASEGLLAHLLNKHFNEMLIDERDK